MTTTEKAASVAARIDELNREIGELEASAIAHETQARADRLKRSERKREAQELTTALRSLAVQKAVESAESAAKTAQRDAERIKGEQEAALEKIKEKERELESLLAKARETSGQ